MSVVALRRAIRLPAARIALRVNEGWKPFNAGKADWEYTKNFRVTFGINSIFNTRPPLSLKVVGGNQVGYDGRYADPTGRAIAAGATFRF